MRFSERNGYKKVLKTIERESISIEIRNQIWNFLYINIWHLQKNEIISMIIWGNFYNDFHLLFLKSPIDFVETEHQKSLRVFRKYFFDLEWHEFLDLIEFILSYYKKSNLNIATNKILEKEFSSYRFINGIITEITDKQEIEILEETLHDEDFPNVKAHLQRALELLSDRKNPDYRNSIKESISAVESIAKEIAKKPKAELAEALKEIEKNGELHGALKKGFLSLYGYTSDANGIRHSLMEKSNLTADDAKFFLLTCTSFINYLKAKM
ncbi:MAG TPA: hypothetical protein PKE69_02810 [Pyrinomonadaceae bacterium]|nr:hypothetical protein [Pyrinomonadaceae bacterium]